IHILTTLDCVNCHTTATFIGGTFDHQGVTGNCGSCHNGLIAIGKTDGHFVTSQDCNVCHSPDGWSPINFTHATSNYPGDHNTTLSCASCHRNNRDTITYSSPGLAPACAGCHEGDYDSGEHERSVSENKNCGQSGCHRVSDRDWE
ncbi:MAG: cytochrome C, partial [Gammaproteobacteria bacterium]|nr:cytochrome C [Gammaproteobacteria bacterium]